MAKVLVLHASYGCDTGCCGHVVQVDGADVGRFSFSHPYTTLNEDAREFAEALVVETLGAEHVKDLDWEHCVVLAD